ncbi:MAG: hypothetical protein KA746_11920 [Pyrinomonadaceae bacterium]|nr:hypothetical protein [Pyrinomonadaceae bacterium]MBP6211700.1 hypothetical protein [Pyrinomonadaceae bacterium]
MQIKREFEITSCSSRRIIIRQAPDEATSVICAKCGEPMVAAGQAAKLLGIGQRRIFQIIENGAVHFAETESGVAIICLKSLAAEQAI